LKEWEKIYLEVGKVTTKYDDGRSMCFETNSINSIWVNDDDIFYTLDDLKKLANDGMPKQGEIIEVRDYDWYWGQRIFVSFYRWKVVAANEHNSVNIWDEWRQLQKKTELTLAEVEERLGMEKWSLIII